MKADLPDWVPDMLRRWWHLRSCACCVEECEWGSVRCPYCMADIEKAKQGIGVAPKRD